MPVARLAIPTAAKIQEELVGRFRIPKDQLVSVLYDQNGVAHVWSIDEEGYSCVDGSRTGVDDYGTKKEKPVTEGMEILKNSGVEVTADMGTEQLMEVAEKAIKVENRRRMVAELIEILDEQQAAYQSMVRRRNKLNSKMESMAQYLAEEDSE